MAVQGWVDPELKGKIERLRDYGRLAEEKGWTSSAAWARTAVAEIEDWDDSNSPEARLHQIRSQYLTHSGAMTATEILKAIAHLVRPEAKDSPNA